MRFVKIGLWIIGLLAFYQATHVLFFGRPVDPEKALTGWSHNEC